jgi:GAF domain-containing protein
VSVPARQVTPALLQVDAILTRLRGTEARAEVCRFLRHEFPHFDWVGVYRLAGPTLELDGWDGAHATEHTSIPVGEGVCGRAARLGRSVIVADVRLDPEYLQCFLETRSEIVVPILGGSTVLGEIDVDGTAVGAFDGSDERFLTEVARRLASSFGGAPGGPVVPGDGPSS